MKLRNGQLNTFGGTIYFAVDGTLLPSFLNPQSDNFLLTNFLKKFLQLKGPRFQPANHISV